MEEERGKGTVMPLASMFGVEDSQKATKHVLDTISDKSKDLERLQGFIADNSNLINLVQKLPEQLHHNIMVPFGKAAFFPGHLIHTNEFMVLLGENYYAERTAKQTVEILKRRGKTWESHVNSLKATIEDLKFKGLYFDKTASEAAEGVVEIREELAEEDGEMESTSGMPEEESPKEDSKNVWKEDEEYARLMAKLDELEKEELAAENAEESDEDDQILTNSNEIADQSVLSQYINDLQRHVGDAPSSTKDVASQKKTPEDNTKQLNFDRSPRPLVQKDTVSHHKSAGSYVEGTADRRIMPAAMEEEFQALELSANEVPPQATKPKHDTSKAFTGSVIEHQVNLQTNTVEKFGSSQAFTGSIIEHQVNLQTNPVEKSGSSQFSSQPTKPVSRFKQQRR